MGAIARRWVLAGLVAAALPSAAWAEDASPPRPQPYFDTHMVDLTELLPPPPASDSPETKAELGELLVVQVTRTPDMVARAEADAIEEVWRFADVLGPKFTPDALPLTAALFDRLLATDNAILEPAKAAFNRPHPYTSSDLVKPIVRPAKSGSWPSSHAAFGTLIGIVLADMLPERRPAIMARAWTYAENRIVAGAHYPSDVEMGRIAGTVIAYAALRQPEFSADYAAARKEVRAALGL